MLRAWYRPKEGGPYRDIFVARSDLAGPLDDYRAMQLAAQVSVTRVDRDVARPRMGVSQLSAYIDEHRTYIANGNRELRLSTGLGYCLMENVAEGSTDIVVREGGVRLHSDVAVTREGYSNVTGAMFATILGDYAPEEGVEGLAGQRFQVYSANPSKLARGTLEKFGLRHAEQWFSGDALAVYQAVGTVANLTEMPLRPKA